MIHFRIIGSIWLISGLVSAVKFPFELWSMATDQQYGITTGFYGALFWISKFLVEVSFLLILLIGWGLLRLQRWAVVGGRFLGVISLLVCLWFILTQGMEHGPEPYVGIWCGVALSAYTIFAVWSFRPYDRIAEGVPPNGGHRLVVRRLTRFLRDQQTKDKTTHMKTGTVITSVLIALVVSIAQAAPDSPTLQHTLTVTPEMKKAFHSGDAIKIRSVTGTAPKFQTGGT